MALDDIQQPGAEPQQAIAGQAPAIISSQSQFSDAQLLEKFKKWKSEAFDQRWVYERQWMRNIWYILGRQWIYWDTQRGQWQDKRLAKWVPRPWTPLPKSSIQAVRANFAAINYGTNARPIGNDHDAVITAGVADDYAPIIHEDHKMDAVMSEFDFWLLATGNAFLHTCVSYERGNGVININFESCQQCGLETSSDKIFDAGQKCPECGGTAFQPAMNPDGSPKVEQRPQPKGLTIPLSPFEIAFPLQYERFDLAPYVIRMRWRDKTYYEGHAEFASTLAKTMSFSKSPADRTMQIFKTMPFQNDLGALSGAYFGMGGSGGQNESEGVTEYDVWVKPCDEFPDGYVVRFAGDKQPVVIHSEQEKLPGPIPYKNAAGDPLFTFTHAYYEHVGGRALGSGLLDPAMQKFDQLNQLDSLATMILMRVANPIWLEPKGAEVEKFTGEPGLVVKWNPLVANGTAKPERIPGENIPQSIFAWRTIIKEEIEEATGTFDILKGERPSGVDAYSSLSLLDEKARGRHTTAYKQRGAAYKDFFKFALEIERQFGAETRTRAVMKETREWAFKVFQRSDLSGNVDIIIEDGTLTPKTSLGERAAIEHLSQLGFLNPADPEQQFEILKQFGQQKLMPGLDKQVQECWMYLEKFEQAMQDPQIVQQLTLAAQQQAMMPPPAQPTDPNMPPVAPPPPPTFLKVKRWYNPTIHRNEVIKWCVSDRGRDLFAKAPMAEVQIDLYLQQLEVVIAQAQMQQAMAQAGPRPPQPGGGGRALANSAQNSAQAGARSSGSAGAKEPK